jgi:glycosyltransferase involved in cell wall biosynthesis
MGRPVVATGVDGVPEAVVPGETGMLTPPENPAALASAIVNLLRNPELARRFGDAARRRVEERFMIQEMIRRYVEFFQEIRPTGEAAGAPAIGHPVREGLP